MRSTLPKTAGGPGALATAPDEASAASEGGVRSACLEGTAGAVIWRAGDTAGGQQTQTGPGVEGLTALQAGADTRGQREGQGPQAGGAPGYECSLRPTPEYPCRRPAV